MNQFLASNTSKMTYSHGFNDDLSHEMLKLGSVDGKMPFHHGVLQPDTHALDTTENAGDCQLFDTLSCDKTGQQEPLCQVFINMGTLP